MPNLSDEHLVALHDLNKNLEVIVALVLRQISRDSNPLPLKEQIAILDGLGIRPVSIARIVGKKSGYVNKELVAIRRARKRAK